MFAELSVAGIVTILVSLVISLSVHEATHAFVAHRLGDMTAALEGRLTLNPLKHIDLMMTIILPAVLMVLGQPPILIARPVPFNPANVRFEEYGAALVGIAGPLSNFGLAVFGSILARSGVFEATITDVLVLFVQVNIGLFVFNMLPLPPLDGSRLLYAFAPEPLQKVMYQIESMGFIMIIVLLLLLLPVLGPVLATVNDAISMLLLG